MRNSVFLLFMFLIGSNGLAQSYIEPVIGFQEGLGKTRLRQLNTAIQYSHITGKQHEILFLLQQSWPLAAGFSDSAFSQNVSLPVYANAQKSVRPFTLSAGLGNRFLLWQINPVHKFSFLLFAGLKYEKINVSYTYDKSNYTILNPDKTRKKLGAYLGFGLEYMYTLRSGRIFVQGSFATAPAGKKTEYPAGSGFIKPLAINAGYSFLIKKSKHEKY